MYLIICDYKCDFVNLKCQIILFNHNKSQYSHKNSDVNRNS